MQPRQEGSRENVEDRLPSAAASDSTTAVKHHHSATALSTMSYNSPHTSSLARSLTHTHSLMSDALPPCLPACLPALAHINPQCHRQLLRPLLAALPTHTRTHPPSQLTPRASSSFHRPPSCFCPAVPPTSLASFWVPPDACNLNSPSVLFRLPACPPAIDDRAAQPKDWPHLGPPTRLDRAPSRLSTQQPELSRRAHTRPELCICQVPSPTSPSLVAFLDATSGCEANVGIGAWANTPARPSRHPLSGNAPSHALICLAQPTWAMNDDRVSRQPLCCSPCAQRLLSLDRQQVKTEPVPLQHNGPFRP